MLTWATFSGPKLLFPSFFSSGVPSKAQNLAKWLDSKVADIELKSRSPVEKMFCTFLLNPNVSFSTFLILILTWFQKLPTHFKNQLFPKITQNRRQNLQKPTIREERQNLIFVPTGWMTKFKKSIRGALQQCNEASLCKFTR